MTGDTNTDSSAAAGRRSETQTYDDADGRPSAAVLGAMTRVAKRDGVTFDTLLYEIIDPDALDSLFGDRYDGGTRTGVGYVAFELDGYVFEVHSDGRVDVR